MRTTLPIAVAVVVFPAAGATIHVDADCPGPGDGPDAEPYCSIQTAIDNAVDTDEIVVAPGTYFEVIDFLGKSIALRSSDGPDVTIIDGTGNFHVVQCVSGEGPGTVLDGFTITGGNAGGDLPLDADGGGMFNFFSSSPTVINCTFSGNTATARGGGMFNSDNSTTTVTNCTFIENSADFGGGMFSGNFTVSKVTNCTFSGNTANYGGGMFNQNADAIVTGCTFSANGNTGGFGGGMYNSGSSSPRVTNCTFTTNSALGGGGMTNLFNSSPTVTNCILWGDIPDEISTNGERTTVAFSIIQGGWPSTGNIDADPLFIAPGNGDFRLSLGSPCIDAGDNAAVPKGVLRDLDGNPRFVADACAGDSGPAVDMGAYEFQGTSCDLSNLMMAMLFDGDASVGIIDLLILLESY